MGVFNITKDFHNLMKNIRSFSDGQASVCYHADDLSLIKVHIQPNSGHYKDGEFIFSIEPNLMKPDEAPRVRCLTQIYHPNIDTIEDDGDLCLSLFDEWQSYFSLEDVVQGLMFLLYNPNLEDALCPIFSPDMTLEEFYCNVKRSLNGERIEGYYFPKNRPRSLRDGDIADSKPLQETTAVNSSEVVRCSEDHRQTLKPVIKEPDGKSKADSNVDDKENQNNIKPVR